MSQIHFDTAGWMQHLGIAKAKISDKRIKKVLKSQAIKAYHAVAEETPQYSGYLVSNLRIQVNGSGEGVATDLAEDHENWRSLAGDYGAVKQKGDEYAIGIAATYNRWFNNFDTNPAFSMGDTVTIRYIVPPEYWRMVEVGLKLRDVNKPGHALARAKASIKTTQRGWQYGSDINEVI